METPRSNMTLVLIAVIASVPPTIAALGTYQQAVAIRRTATDIELKTDHVVKLTNSGMTEVRDSLALASKRLQEANQRIISLERALAVLSPAGGTNGPHPDSR